MTVLLDTSILVGIEARRLSPDAVVEPAVISVITVEELYRGVLLAQPRTRVERQQTYEEARRGFEVLDVDVEIALVCARIRAEGRERSVRYAPFDSLIGATARVHALPLYTQDEGMLGMVGVDVRVV